MEAIWTIDPLRLTKVTLFTMIFYNSENSIRDVRPFVVHCCVTAVLRRILHHSYSSESVMRLAYPILLKSPP